MFSDDSRFVPLVGSTLLVTNQGWDVMRRHRVIALMRACDVRLFDVIPTRKARLDAILRGSGGDMGQIDELEGELPEIFEERDLVATCGWGASRSERMTLLRDYLQSDAVDDGWGAAVAVLEAWRGDGKEEAIDYMMGVTRDWEPLRCVNMPRWLKRAIHRPEPMLRLARTVVLRERMLPIHQVARALESAERATHFLFRDYPGAYGVGQEMSALAKSSRAPHVVHIGVHFSAYDYRRSLRVFELLANSNLPSLRSLQMTFELAYTSPFSGDGEFARFRERYPDVEVDHPGLSGGSS